MNTSAKSAHTPGPWHVSGFEIEAHGSARVVMGADGFSIAHVMDRSPRENEADARLIAAAPDMLAALRAAADRLVAINEFTSQGSPVTLATIRAAIVAATGSQP